MARSTTHTLNSIPADTPALPVSPVNAQSGGDSHALHLALASAGVATAITIPLVIWLGQWMFNKVFEDWERRLAVLEGEDYVRTKDLQLLIEPIKLGQEKDEQRLARLQASFDELRVELGNNYVRREDWLRFATAVEAKLDTLVGRIDRALLNPASK